MPEQNPRPYTSHCQLPKQFQGNREILVRPASSSVAGERVKLSQSFSFGNLAFSDKGQWDCLLSASKQSTPFHSHEWAQVLRQGFPDLTSIYWGLWMNKELVAVLPSSIQPTLGGNLLSPLHHSDYFAACPAIRDDAEMTSLPHLLSGIAGFMKRHHILGWSFRVPRNSPFLEVASRSGLEIRPSLASSVLVHTTETPETLWKRAPHGGLRTCVRKAEREGLEVRESSDLRDMEEYLAIKGGGHSVANKKTRSEATHFHDLYGGIHRLLLPSGKAKFFVASHRNNIIGGAVVFVQNDKAYVWSMGSLRSACRMHPNHTLIWSIIRWAHSSRINSIDFGTTSRTSGSCYFAKRNLADSEIIDHVVVTLSVNRIWSHARASLAAAYAMFNAHGLWAPRVLLNICAEASGVP